MTHDAQLTDEEMAVEMAKRTAYSRDDWLRAIRAIFGPVDLELLDKVAYVGAGTRLSPYGVVVNMRTTKDAT